MLKTYLDIFLQLQMIIWPVFAVLSVFVWFVISLILFLRTPEDHPKRKLRRTLMIISAVISGVFFLLLLVLSVLMTIAVKNM